MYEEDLQSFNASLRVILVRENQPGFSRGVSTSEEWSLLSAEQGQFRYSLGRESGIVHPGQSVLCPPHVPLQRQALGPITFHYARFDLRAYDRCGQTIAFPYSGKWAFEDNARSLTTLVRMRQSMSDRPTPYLEHLLHDLFHQYIEEKRQSGERKAQLPEDPRICEAMAILSQQLAQPLSIRELAHHLGWSHSRFIRSFSRHTHSTPLRFLTGLRIEKAKSLLVETRFSLERIAPLCGYPNGFYLSRVFAKETGLSPSEYRKRYRV